MDIFKRFKKRIQEKNKYKRLEELFAEIVILFPDGSASLDIHHIELAELDKRVWYIESRIGGLTKPYAIARRINRKNTPFDIALFGEVKK